ncbi:ADYC domain-containing protein [Hyalangium versicolor]|uniref:ADYC domain-containing protein n=1 Tax=Hyalangium versicolor TaxID=2861190 RepID=UPI001CCA63E5|nr:ADYC domain-containing protein [Hyalangium versicolor]
MTSMKKLLLTWMCLQLPALAHAAGPSSAKSERSKAASVAPAVPVADRYARRCQSQGSYRTNKPQGTMLWGTKRDWNTEKPTDENRSVLVSADFEPLRQADAGVKALKLEGSRLVTQASATQGIVGTVLQGTDSDGKPVEIALCGAEPSTEDPEVTWYRIEAWNAVAQEWENPCVALDRVPDPRALAVAGVWDASGAHKASAGKFTFACENGAITKCIRWGYKPWASRDGQSLADLHQACTRMARADYCGNGRSHTHQDTIIDIYDRLGVLTRTTETSSEWDPRRAAFEAAWAPDGALCLAKTRDGRAMSTILQECPDRFRTGAALELGEGDRCTVQRAGAAPGKPMLRNMSYKTP